MNIPVMLKAKGAEPRYKVHFTEEDLKRPMFDVKAV